MGRVRAKALYLLGDWISHVGRDADSIHAAKSSGRLRSTLATLGHRFRSRQYRLDDVVISGASADVAFEFVPHRRLVESLRMAGDHVGRRHDHAGRAETALQTMMLPERRLHRMQFRAVGKSFDCKDIRAGSLCGKHCAGLHRLAVDMHHTGAALRRVAAHMRSGKSQILPEKMDQKRSVLDVGAHTPPIHHQRYVGHDPSLGALPRYPPFSGWNAAYIYKLQSEKRF